MRNKTEIVYKGRECVPEKTCAPNILTQNINALKNEYF